MRESAPGPVWRGTEDLIASPRDRCSKCAREKLKHSCGHGRSCCCRFRHGDGAVTLYVQLLLMGRPAAALAGSSRKRCGGLTPNARNRCSDGTLTSKPQNHGAQDCPPSVDNDKLDMTSAP